MIMRKIEILLNGDYLCTTTRSRTRKEAITRVRELAKDGLVIVGGRGHVEVKESDSLSANFVK
jgi:hypothetical protein